MGALLFLAMAGTNYGPAMTSISNTVFRISMTAVFVPLFSTIIYRKLPERKIIVGAIGAAICILHLTVTGIAGIGVGDALCIIGAAVCAVHIMTAKKTE